MARRANGALDALTEAMPKYPFIWGLTSRWFKGDKVWVVPLTADLLKTFSFSTWSDGHCSWEVLQRFPKNKGEEVLNDLDRYSGKRKRISGLPLAQVLRRYSNVHVIVKFEAWVNHHRQVTLYTVPQGSRGSKLRALCGEALRNKAALRRAVEAFQAAAVAHSEVVMRRLAKKRRNIDLPASLENIRKQGKSSLKKILKAANLV